MLQGVVAHTLTATAVALNCSPPASPPPATTASPSLQPRATLQEEVEAEKEVEDELWAAMETDPLAAYDIDVREEGEVIRTLRALCRSTQQD